MGPFLHASVPGELAVQIEKEVYKFNKLLGLRSTTFAGGLSKYQQFKTIKGAGCCPESMEPRPSEGV